MTAENSILQNAAHGHVNQSQVYGQNLANKDATGVMKLDLEPTKGVADQGTAKRRQHKVATASLSETHAEGDEDEDEDDNEEVAEIGTRRQQSHSGSQHELVAVNRFNSHQKNQSINQS